MKISTKGRYALKIMLNLAKKYKDDSFVSLKEIADEENISLKYLEKIMPNLSKKGFFISLRGSVGGYKLAHEPHEYKIGDILRAAEGDMSPVSCVSDGFTCPVKKKCKTFYLWRDLNNVINDFLDSKTLDEYMED